MITKTGITGYIYSNIKGRVPGFHHNNKFISNGRISTKNSFGGTKRFVRWKIVCGMRMEFSEINIRGKHQRGLPVWRVEAGKNSPETK